MNRISRLISLAVVMAAAGGASGGVSYEDPEGGWAYLYTGEGVASDEGESLDGTWDHNNGSDAWDGSMIGDDAPGGVSSFVEGNVTYARFEDTGDPRNDGFADPSNRKIYLTHDTSEFDDGELMLSGVTLTFRTRLATTGPLDRPVGAKGDGYYILDNGKANFSYRSEFANVISFALTTDGSTNDDLGEFASGGLLMNNYDPGGNEGNVDTNESGEHREFQIADPTAWNEFWITIKEGPEFAEYEVDVYANGSVTPEKFIVTGGSGNDGSFGNYMGLGVHSTGQAGAFDVDFYGFKPGIHIPVSGGGGLLGDYNDNGVLDAEDPDFIIGAIGTNNAKYDVDGDGSVTAADLNAWVKRDDYAKSWIGDANLDGEFKSNDFVTVFLAGKYETGGAAKYGEGDWNGDGLFTSNDFVAAFLDGGYELGPRTAVAAAVPEPAGLALLSCGVLALLGICRRK